MAMMKFGFMPIEESSDPTVSFSTAPAANSTAMRMRSCVVRPAFFCGAAATRLRAPAGTAPAACEASFPASANGRRGRRRGCSLALSICRSMSLSPFLAEVPAGRCPSRGVWSAGTNFADEGPGASAGPTRSARKLPRCLGSRGWRRRRVLRYASPSASPRDRVPQASAASARSAVRQNGGTKKDLSFSSKDRSLTCGATFTIDSADAEPSHEHANTCSALDAGSRSRYSVASRRACALRPPTFPLSLGEPFTIQLTAGIPAAPALCECS